MNIKHLAAAAALMTAAGFALADGDVTRAQVQAELVQARAAGLLDTNDATFPVIPAVASTLTRAQVQAQVVQARAAGQLDISDATYPVIASSGAAASRADVRAQVLQARAAGQLDLNEANYPASYPQPSVKKTQAN